MGALVLFVWSVVIVRVSRCDLSENSTPFFNDKQVARGSAVRKRLFLYGIGPRYASKVYFFYDGTHGRISILAWNSARSKAAASPPHSKGLRRSRWQSSLQIASSLWSAVPQYSFGMVLSSAPQGPGASGGRQPFRVNIEDTSRCCRLLCHLRIREMKGKRLSNFVHSSEHLIAALPWQCHQKISWLP